MIKTSTHAYQRLKMK